jgi:hypothetical protein
VRLSPLGTSATDWLLYQPWMIDKCGAVGGIRIVRGNRSTWKKTCLNTTFSTRNHTWLDLGSNPSRHGRKPATNRLSLVLQLKLVMELWTVKWLLPILKHQSASHRRTSGKFRKKNPARITGLLTQIQTIDICSASVYRPKRKSAFPVVMIVKTAAIQALPRAKDVATHYPRLQLNGYRVLTV